MNQRFAALVCHSQWVRDIWWRVTFLPPVDGAFPQLGGWRAFGPHAGGTPALPVRHTANLRLCHEMSHTHSQFANAVFVRWR